MYIILYVNRKSEKLYLTPVEYRGTYPLVKSNDTLHLYFKTSTKIV